jgi:hypothetical protein
MKSPEILLVSAGIVHTPLAGRQGAAAITPPLPELEAESGIRSEKSSDAGTEAIRLVELYRRKLVEYQKTLEERKKEPDVP